MKKINFNSATSVYITGILITVAAIFIISGVFFLVLLANKLDTVMSSPSAITYTYFIMIMDRVILFAFIFAILPLSFYQWCTKDSKSPSDKLVSTISIFVIFAFIFTFISGELHFLDKYKEGKLENSKLFSTHQIEMQIFDKMLNNSANTR